MNSWIHHYKAATRASVEAAVAAAKALGVIASSSTPVSLPSTNNAASTVAAAVVATATNETTSGDAAITLSRAINSTITATSSSHQAPAAAALAVCEAVSSVSDKLTTDAKVDPMLVEVLIVLLAFVLGAVSSYCCIKIDKNSTDRDVLSQPDIEENSEASALVLAEDSSQKGTIPPAFKSDPPTCASVPTPLSEEEGHDGKEAPLNRAAQDICTAKEATVPMPCVEQDSSVLVGISAPASTQEKEDTIRVETTEEKKVDGKASVSEPISSAKTEDDKKPAAKSKEIAKPPPFVTSPRRFDLKSVTGDDQKSTAKPPSASYVAAPNGKKEKITEKPFSLNEIKDKEPARKPIDIAKPPSSASMIPSISPHSSPAAVEGKEQKVGAHPFSASNLVAAIGNKQVTVNPFSLREIEDGTQQAKSIETAEPPSLASLIHSTAPPALDSAEANGENQKISAPLIINPEEERRPNQLTKSFSLNEAIQAVKAASFASVIDSIDSTVVNNKRQQVVALSMINPRENKGSCQLVAAQEKLLGAPLEEESSRNGGEGRGKPQGKNEVQATRRQEAAIAMVQLETTGVTHNQASPKAARKETAEDSLSSDGDIAKMPTPARKHAEKRAEIPTPRMVGEFNKSAGSVNQNRVHSPSQKLQRTINSYYSVRKKLSATFDHCKSIKACVVGAKRKGQGDQDEGSPKKVAKTKSTASPGSRKDGEQSKQVEAPKRKARNSPTSTPQRLSAIQEDHDEGFCPDPLAEHVRPKNFPKDEEDQVQSSLALMQEGYTLDNVTKGRAAFLCSHCNWCRYFKSSENHFHDFNFVEYKGRYVVDFSVWKKLEGAQLDCVSFNKWRRHMRTHSKDKEGSNSSNILPALYVANPMIRRKSSGGDGISSPFLSVDDNTNAKVAENPPIPASQPSSRQALAPVGRSPSNLTAMRTKKGEVQGKGFQPDSRASHVVPPMLPKEKEEELVLAGRKTHLKDLNRGMACFACAYCDWCTYFSTSEKHFGNFKFLEHQGNYVVDFRDTSAAKIVRVEDCSPFQAWRKHTRQHVKSTHTRQICVGNITTKTTAPPPLFIASRKGKSSSQGGERPKKILKIKD